MKPSATAALDEVLRKHLRDKYPDGLSTIGAPTLTHADMVKIKKFMPPDSVRLEEQVVGQIIVIVAGKSNAN